MTSKEFERNSQIEDEIVKLCEVHYKRRQRQQER